MFTVNVFVHIDVRFMKPLARHRRRRSIARHPGGTEVLVHAVTTGHPDLSEPGHWGRAADWRKTSLAPWSPRRQQDHSSGGKALNCCRLPAGLVHAAAQKNDVAYSAGRGFTGATVSRPWRCDPMLPRMLAPQIGLLPDIAGRLERTPRPVVAATILGSPPESAAVWR